MREILSRRNFLKASVGVGALAGAYMLLPGCLSLLTEERSLKTDRGVAVRDTILTINISDSIKYQYFGSNFHSKEGYAFLGDIKKYNDNSVFRVSPEGVFGPIQFIKYGFGNPKFGVGLNRDKYFKFNYQKPEEWGMNFPFEEDYPRPFSVPGILSIFYLEPDLKTFKVRKVVSNSYPIVTTPLIYDPYNISISNYWEVSDQPQGKILGKDHPAQTSIFLTRDDNAGAVAWLFEGYWLMVKPRG